MAVEELTIVFKHGTLDAEFALTVVEHLRTVKGKADAKALESRYIKTYEKIHGFKPGYVDEEGNFIPIQKGNVDGEGYAERPCVPKTFG